MLVETYEEVAPELVTEQIEAEALDLCNELSLDGQLRYHQNANQDPAFIPYRRVKKDEMAAIKSFFGDHYGTSVAKYDAGPIPLEVLKVIALCEKNDWFQELLIFHDKQHNPDPVLLGKKGYDDYCLLARWGDALMPWPEFIEIAAERKTQKSLEIAKRALRQIKNYISAIEDGYILPVDRDKPSFYNFDISIDD